MLTKEEVMGLEASLMDALANLSETRQRVTSARAHRDAAKATLEAVELDAQVEAMANGSLGKNETERKLAIARILDGDFQVRRARQDLRDRENDLAHEEDRLQDALDKFRALRSLADLWSAWMRGGYND